MRRFNEFNVQRQLLAILGSLPIFGWVCTYTPEPLSVSVHPITGLQGRNCLTQVGPCSPSPLPSLEQLLTLNPDDFMLATSAIYPMTQHYRPSTPLEQREGYSITALSPCITAEIAMQASSYSEALLRGKEQLNGYVVIISVSDGAADSGLLYRFC